jgi:proline dehydrogenase
LVGEDHLHTNFIIGIKITIKPSTCYNLLLNEDNEVRKREMSLLKEPILKLARNQKMRGFVTSNKLGRGAARRFVAGETLQDAIAATQEANRTGLHVSLNHLGENTTSEVEANQATTDLLNLLDAIAEADANVSLKLTSLGQDIDQRLCLENIGKILTRAEECNNIFVRLDMEGSGYTQKTLDVFRQLWGEGRRNTGVVLQSYLYRTATEVEDMIRLGARVRLCKGAYLEPPTVAFPEKSEVDQSYVRCMERLMSEGNYPGLATHDEKIINHALEYAKEHRIGPERFEFQMLYGIRRDLQKKLVAQGYNVRVYMPYGSEWYPYLIRRMAERPANLFFIASQFFRG